MPIFIICSMVFHFGMIWKCFYIQNYRFRSDRPSYRLIAAVINGTKQCQILSISSYLFFYNPLKLTWMKQNKQGQWKAFRIPSPNNLTLWPWPLTLKINRVPDSLKDYVCTKFGENPLKDVDSRVFTRMLCGKKLTQWPWPLTLKINRVPDSLKD